MDFLQEVADAAGRLSDNLGDSVDVQQAISSLEGLIPSELINGMQEFWPLLLVLFILFFVVELFELPLKLIWNGLIGAGTLFVINLIGSLVGFTMKITIWKALVAGVLGIPGTIAVIIYEIFG